VKQKSSENIDGKSQIEFMGGCQLFKAKNTIQSASVKNTISTSISPYLFNPSDKTERTLSNDIKRLCHKTLLADNGWKTIPGVGEILDMTNATHIKLKYEKVYFTGNGSGTQTFTVSR